MNFWNKIVKAVKDSPVTKGLTLNKITRMVNKSTKVVSDLNKTFGSKGTGAGRTGGLGGTGEIISAAKAIAQKLKSGGFMLKDTVKKTANKMAKDKVIPNQKEIHEAFDKVTNQIRRQARQSKDILDKFNYRQAGSRAYKKTKQQTTIIKNKVRQASNIPMDTVKQASRKASEGMSNTVKKVQKTINSGTKAILTNVLKYAMVGILIYGIGSAIPRQLRKYFIQKQEIKQKGSVDTGPQFAPFNTRVTQSAQRFPSSKKRAADPYKEYDYRRVRQQQVDRQYRN